MKEEALERKIKKWGLAVEDELNPELGARRR